jgi:hypothetical protein
VSKFACLVLCLTLIMPAAVRAVEPPIELGDRGRRRRQTGITLDNAAVAGVNVYRSASDPGAEFKRVAKVNKKRPTTRRSRRRYLLLLPVALDPAGREPNKSELVSVTSAPTQGTTGKRRAGSADFGAKLFNFEPHTTVFSYHPGTGEGAWLDNCTGNKFGDWRRFEPFRVPAAKADDQITFGAKPDAFICWVWNPDSGKLQYAFCRDTVRFETFTVPLRLPKPPNFGPETVARQHEGLHVLLFYNPKDGSVYMSRSTGDMFTNWTPFGSLAPPNYDPSTTHIGFGAIEGNRGKRRSRADTGSMPTA